jgi:hypothetical protein
MTEAVLLTFPTQKYTMPITPPRRLRRDDRSGALLTDEHAARLTRSGRLQARDMAVLETVWMLGAMTPGQTTPEEFGWGKGFSFVRSLR